MTKTLSNVRNRTEAKIVKLSPPKITASTILEKLVCTRPVHEGKFNISVEHYNGKKIVNCYGHGGSGWTTLFGSVDKAIALFKATNPNPHTPIRVIGAGCMGLTAAIELTRNGFPIAGISAKSLYDTPSWKAAGYFGLVSVKTSPEEQANLNEMGLNTFLAYQKIERASHPYITQDAVKSMPVYCSIDTDAGVEDLERRGMIPPHEYVSLDFGNDVIHHDYVKYMTYFMNTTSLMCQLTNEVVRLKMVLEEKTLFSFDQVAEDVIFNCSGLGGRELNSDSDMIPVRGHLVTLNEHAGCGHMDYMIYTQIMQEGRQERIYLFPKNNSVTPKYKKGVACAGVLGGTFLPHVDQLSLSEQEEIDRVEFKRLLERNSQFFQGCPF